MIMKIAIIGTAPSSRHLAPIGNSAWTTWVCSPDNRDLTGVDAWFELHHNVTSRPTGKEFVDFLRGLDVPLYAHPDSNLCTEGAATAFPLRALEKKFGSTFLTSSIALMFAYAMTLPGVDEIGIFGVDMAHGTEYQDQRMGLLHFIEKAEDAGITVTVPEQSSLRLPRRAYGDRLSPQAAKLEARISELTTRLNDTIVQCNTLASQRDTLLAEVKYLEGARDDAIDILRTIVV